MNAPLLAPLVLSGLLFALSAPAHAQQIKKVVTGIGITCPPNFDVKGGRCVANAAALATLDASTCKGKGLAFVGTPPKCFAVEEQEPVPECAASAIKTEFDAKLQQCVTQDEIPRSSLGDYIGDCFRIGALPSPPPPNLVAGEVYAVMSQRPEGTTDKVLTLSGTTDGGRWKCGSNPKSTEFTIKASELIAMGASRNGWAYGVLALPFKFHFDDKSFGSGISIGPYFGRRWGTPGSAYTLAMAATIGSVKGEVRDAQGNITGTPDLQAFSLALGYMYDIAKGVDTRPFKIGFFVGTDVVGADNGVKYKHNKKPWLAFQIGFDFTDN